MSRRYVLPEDEVLAEWLRDNRERVRVSQTRLAQLLGGHRVGVHSATIARLESAEQPCTFGLAIRLGAVLGADLPIATAADCTPTVCQACLGNPPKGFTCNACGVSS